MCVLIIYFLCHVYTHPLLIVRSPLQTTAPRQRVFLHNRTNTRIKYHNLETLVSNRHLPPGHSRFLCFTANVKSWERGTICVLLFRIRYNWYCYWKVSNKWIHDKFLVLVSYPTSMSILDIQDHRSYTMKYDIFHHRR